MPSGRSTDGVGRLANWNTAGVMGVLDGCGPSSMGSTGKALRAKLGELGLSVRAPTSETGRRLSISSSSSMEGNARENSTGVR
jgi:hypothetical protein